MSYHQKPSPKSIQLLNKLLSTKIGNLSSVRSVPTMETVYDCQDEASVGSKSPVSIRRILHTESDAHISERISLLQRRGTKLLTQFHLQHKRYSRQGAIHTKDFSGLRRLGTNAALPEFFVDDPMAVRDYNDFLRRRKDFIKSQLAQQEQIQLSIKHKLEKKLQNAQTQEREIFKRQQKSLQKVEQVMQLPKIEHERTMNIKQKTPRLNQKVKVRLQDSIMKSAFILKIADPSLASIINE